VIHVGICFLCYGRFFGGLPYGSSVKDRARGCIQSLGGVSMTDSEGLWTQLVCCAPHLSMVPLISDKVQ
jgi:hypothetical protein